MLAERSVLFAEEYPNELEDCKTWFKGCCNAPVPANWSLVELFIWIASDEKRLGDVL